MARDRRPETPASWPDGYRGRLMSTMAIVASERGYSATRVRDVLDYVGISRRTFYVYFANVDECFFATYNAIVGDVASLIGPGAAPGLDVDVEPVIGRVLEHFARWPAHAQVFLVEILSAGPRGAQRYEEAMTMLATRLASCPRWQPGDCDSLKRPDVAQATIGALSRMVQRRLLNGDGRELVALFPSLVALTTRVGVAAGNGRQSQ